MFMSLLLSVCVVRKEGDNNRQKRGEDKRKRVTGELREDNMKKKK